VPLSVYCLYQYGICRVANITEKGFHLPMFLMILSCGILYILAGSLILGLGINLPTPYFDSGAYKTAVVAISVCWGLNYFLHAQFITKFWVLSRRVESILLQKDNQAAMKQGVAISTVMSFLSLLVVVTCWITLWNGKYDSAKGIRYLFGFLLCTVPLILLAILVSAFQKLNSLPKQSFGQLSRKHVVTMLISNGTYAVLLPITLILEPKDHNQFIAYTIFIVLSYAAVLLGLIQVTHMMC
jgi:hypothetical protein